MPIRILFLSRHGRIVVSLWLALRNPSGRWFGDTAVLSTAPDCGARWNVVLRDITASAACHILILAPIVHLPTRELNQNVVIIVDQSSRLFRIFPIPLFTYGVSANFL